MLAYRIQVRHLSTFVVCLYGGHFKSVRTRLAHWYLAVMAFIIVVFGGSLYATQTFLNADVAESRLESQLYQDSQRFAETHSQQFGETQLSLALYSIKADAHYADAVSGVIYNGAYLIHHGLPVNLVGDFDSHMVHLMHITERKGVRG